jgi:hypothetical protein
MALRVISHGSVVSAASSYAHIPPLVAAQSAFGTKSASMRSTISQAEPQRAGRGIRSQSAIGLAQSVAAH